MKRNKKNKKGFTLIELLVVIGVFSGIVTFIVGIFITNLKMQRKTMTVQKTIGEISYAMEYMGRSIRMAQNDYEGTCLEEGEKGYTYGVPAGGNGIQFINYEGDCVKFFLEDGLLKKGVRETGVWNDYRVTSGLLEIQNFRTSANVSPPPTGSGQLYLDQPSVTLFLKVKETEEDWWQTRIQSTITRRRLDFERLQ